MDQDEIWLIEERFWTAGDEHYRSAMHPRCLMSFAAPAGVMTGAAILDSLRGAARWSSVSMDNRRLEQPVDGVVVIAYDAEGSRADLASYRARCTSTYCRARDGWLLVQHQQTPLEPG